ncbi:translation initiation factor IF-2-like [Moschus berezovskii]|uniref:translation initiation factor IF-2-like n=1 Tax=Moschus berezovskii TaxID=68408 RepID=UPI00244524DA|nr:translation initiation factor IF-2-like [Moschus berezovskii]
MGPTSDRGGVASGCLPRLYCALFRSRVWKTGMLKGPAPARDLDPWPREARPEPYPAGSRARRGHVRTESEGSSTPPPGRWPGWAQNPALPAGTQAGPGRLVPAGCHLSRVPPGPGSHTGPLLGTAPLPGSPLRPPARPFTPALPPPAHCLFPGHWPLLTPSLTLLLHQRLGSPPPQALPSPGVSSPSRPGAQSRSRGPAPPRASGPAPALARNAPLSHPPPASGVAGSRVARAPCRLSRAREAAPTLTPAGQGPLPRRGRRAEQRGGHRPRPARLGGDASGRPCQRRPPGARRTLHSAARAAGTGRLWARAPRAGNRAGPEPEPRREARGL